MPLLHEYRLGPLTLPNRVVMAPMTRNRAPGTVPGSHAPTYYAQRAGAGLIVAEATHVSPSGQGYPDTPGIWRDDHVRGWRRVTDAVHAAGGRIFVQIWHVGRISHPSILGGALPVAPSPVRPAGEIFTSHGPQPMVTPRELANAEMRTVVEEHRRGAVNAREAGFDGVEIHAANGYLLDQFLQTGTNQRQDAYGGSPENRARLLAEVVAAVAEVWPRELVGVRVSPGATFNDMFDEDPAGTHSAVARALDAQGVGYVHVIESSQFAPTQGLGEHSATAIVREHYSGVVIMNGSLTRDSAEDVIRSGAADLASFGRPFVANPDLPERFRRGAPLAEPDQATLYGGGAAGYTDYPTLDSALPPAQAA